MLNLTTNRTYPATLTGTTLGSLSNAVTAKVNVVRLALRARFAFVPMQGDAWPQTDQPQLHDSISHRISASSARCLARSAAPAWAAPKPSRAAKPAAGEAGRSPVARGLERSRVVGRTSVVLPSAA